MACGFAGLKRGTLQALSTAPSHTDASEAKAVHGSTIAYFIRSLLMILFVMYFRPKDKCTLVYVKSQTPSAIACIVHTHRDMRTYQKTAQI